jgi:hypothetical protein
MPTYDGEGARHRLASVVVLGPVILMSEAASTHPGRNSSLNSRGVLNVRPCEWSVHLMPSAYCLVMVTKSLRLKAS